MTRTDRIAQPWGTRTPYGPGEPWPVRVDTRLADGVTPDQVERWVQSAAILHSNGDGLDIEEGDLVEVATPRGTVRAAARVSGIRDGVLFLPFHYGYWDTDGGFEPKGDGRAGNELTATEWDPVSKQPLFKTAAARLRRLGPTGTPAPAPTTTASALVAGAAVPATTGGGAGRADEEPHAYREEIR
ncbi:molybdopterin dinucleotide binding domain-containing protein [Streptomyces sp. IBSBF 3010]|uniref:molybdopterin dinucleotide binding domain-containing protein n=1 Tax=Streptomyces sp. IBSBF 3010 TaxID=2903526 RepID=UPI003FA72348